MAAWLFRSFNELKNTELYDLLALRQTVFVLEQHCLFMDLDYFDQKAVHLLGYEEGKLVAYLRIFDKDSAYPGATSFGRVVTAPDRRGKNLGRALMKEVLLYLDKKSADVPIVIGAQHYLVKFYESFGFNVFDEPYDEDGIMHVKMVRKCETQNLT